VIVCEKTPALHFGAINRNWDFWWFGIAFRQVFVGVMVRVRRPEEVKP
jgi:hypothetical protein